MNLHQFQALLPKSTQAFEEQEHKRKAVVIKTKAVRQRGAGGGSQFAHELTDQMLLLIYYRLYLTQEFLTLLFKHQHKSSISRNIHHMRALFEEVLPTHQKARDKVLSLAKKEQERRGKRIGSVKEFQRSVSRIDFHH